MAGLPLCGEKRQSRPKPPRRPPRGNTEKSPSLRSDKQSAPSRWMRKRGKKRSIVKGLVQRVHILAERRFSSPQDKSNRKEKKRLPALTERRPSQIVKKTAIPPRYYNKRSPSAPNMERKKRGGHVAVDRLRQTAAYQRRKCTIFCLQKRRHHTSAVKKEREGGGAIGGRKG